MGQICYIDVALQQGEKRQVNPAGAMNGDNHFELRRFESVNAGWISRERAEAEFLGSGLNESEHQDEVSPEAIERMKSELQIQKIQLRLQSEEIERLRAASDLSQTADLSNDFGDLIDSLGGISWAATYGTLRMSFISKNVERILGYPVSDWLNIDDFWQNHIHPQDRDEVVEKSFIETRRGRGHRLAYRMLSADGRTVWLDDLVGVELKDGEPYKLYGVMVDVTALKEAESRLSLQNELLSQIATGLPLKESLTSLALAIEKQFGDLRCSILLADDDGVRLRHGAAPSLPEAFTLAIDGVAIGDSAGSCGTAAFRRELVVVEDTSQDPLWANYTELASQYSLRACWSTPIIDSGGGLLGTFAIYKHEAGRPSKEHLQHIELATQIAIIAINKERTEVALRKSEREQRSVLNSIPGLVARVDRGLRYQYVNDQYERVFEKPRGYFLGQNILGAVGSELFDQVEPFYNQALAGNHVTYECQSSKNTGTAEFWLTNLVPELNADDEVVGFVVMAFDISANKQAHFEQEKAQDLLKKIADEVPGFVYQYRLRPDGTSCFPYVSEGIRKICSIAPEDLRDDATVIFGLHHPDDQERIASSVLSSAKNLTPWSEEYRFRFNDGTVRWVFGHSMPERAPDGSTLWHGYIADVTERKNAEAELEVKTKLLELTGELAKVGGWEVDLISNRSSWTSETFRIHEMDPGVEPSVDQAIDFYELSARPVIQAAVTAGIENGTPWNLELPLITAKGRRIWVHAHGFPVRDNGKVVKLIGAFQDITERKASEASRVALETKLQESQKLEAIGTLAGGIAHDFNNILTIILGNVELGQMALQKGNQIEVEASFEEIRKAGQRARDLVRQILSFSRRQPTHRTPINLSLIVEESIRLLRATLSPRVTIEAEVAADIPSVNADANLIQQVIVNLATNSMQALRSQPGCIRIRLETVSIVDDSCSSHPAILEMHAKHPGPLVRLIVSDNGCGMDASITSRIFDPFFTTSEVGVGTGLGLSVVHGIVRSHSGEIVVTSEPGVGSTFEIYLPPEPLGTTSISRLDTPGTSSFGSSHLAESSARSNSRVLLIDDEIVLLRTVKSLLEACGCQVSAYSDPIEAIGVFRREPSAFDWALVDYNMAGMCGIEVTQCLRWIRNDLHVVIMSGLVDDELISLANAAGVQELLPKPFLEVDLSQLLKRLGPFLHESRY